MSDAANAVFDGTSAVMLSGETAMGDFPIETVQMMGKIAEYAEAHLPYAKLLHQATAADATSRTEAICQGVTEIATDIGAAAIVCSTASGDTARQFARLRASLPILAATPHVSTYRQLALSWGVFPMLVTETTSGDERVAAMIQAVRKTGWIRQGETIAVATGRTVGTAGGTNGFRLETI